MINRLRISCTSRAYWEIVGPLSEWHSRYISFTVSLRTGLPTPSHPHLMARKKRKKERKKSKRKLPTYIFLSPQRKREKKTRRKRKPDTYTHFKPSPLSLPLYPDSSSPSHSALHAAVPSPRRPAVAAARSLMPRDMQGRYPSARC